MSASLPLQDLRRLAPASLPDLLASLDPAAPLVVSPEQAAAHAAALRGRLLWVWPLPSGADAWIEAYEQQALQVLQQRLAAPAWQIRAADGGVIRSGGEPVVAGPERPSLAVVSPLPPERSGISDYTAALLPALSEHYNVVLIHPEGSQLEVCLDARGEPLPVHPPEWLDGAQTGTLRILYHFGNSQFHEPMLQLMLRHPGVVVLHDYYLSHLMNGWCRHGEAATPLEALLYHCHGYPALQEYSRERPSGGHGHLWSYSLNQPVLQAARGVLVHSPHSLSLAQRDYQAASLLHWHQVPMLSRAPQPVSAAVLDAVRSRFGFSETTRLICSFGYVGPSKLSLELVEAFALSGLARQGWMLVLAGSEGGNTAYRRQLEAAIEAAGLEGLVHLSGWIDAEVYAGLQQLSAINVQLRSRSRGETSAAVMDCLQSGAALIVNRHGSLDDLPDQVCRKLPDQFSSDELVAALVQLAADDQARDNLGRQARQLCLEHHSPEVCAQAYRQAIEAVYQRPGHPLDVARALASQPDYRRLPPAQRLSLINDLAARLPAQPSPRRLYVDVSAIAQTDLGTGIQRVTSSICRELLAQLPPGWLLEPVQASPDREGYRTAPAYSGALFGIPAALLPAEEPVLPNAGDLFLGLDLHHAVVEAQASWYERIQARGARVWFVVYDLLPCLLPDCFPPGTDGLHERWLQTVARASGAVCISRTVAADLDAWLLQCRAQMEGDRDTPLVRWFHQGADLPATPSQRLPLRLGRLGSPASEPLQRELLMVGTIEPRKGYLQVLQAMEKLWEEGVPLQLTIVGREGWKALPDSQRRNLPETIALLQSLQRRYPQLLRWLNQASDQELLATYRKADALLAASFGEGFGLPLVEARRNGLAVIARDLPVFREVVADDAEYFVAEDPSQLALWLADWHQRQAGGQAFGSVLDSLRSRQPQAGISWQQSCGQLLQALQIAAPDASAL